MKTTVELPDDLYRRAKAEAALGGRKFKESVEEGLRLALEAAPAEKRGEVVSSYLITVHRFPHGTKRVC